ncbi:MAG: nucleotidyltransferase domain-containing protein, partial [Alphaproteobacteria bacterium]|nr:nucleotidyltransferase domain-containing protein [Alphaproteobacteria bacterium]
MRSDLDHLPPGKQRELARVTDILFAEFADAMKNASSAKKKDGRILKIVLFGSYARGGWVDEPHTAKGYLSDYDLLIVVNQQSVVDFATYWYHAEDKLMHDAGLKTPVNFIVHTLDEVNNALAMGQYFFSDIIKDGIALYDLKGST